ncbi:hypothetical protein EIK77_002097 [Talaromyces pinophilus]|nr:hypothetical protein EIK77_002097 [Talaromyces pinophilus]
MEEKASLDKIPAAEPILISDAQEGENPEPSPVNTLQKREDGTDYPSGLKLFLIILALCLSYWQQDFATVPPRIFLKRTVWSAAIFTFCIGAAFLSSVYYLPIWFQAVKSASAVNSGVMNLPLLISNVVASIISGVAVTTFGYYTPFMLLASVITPISYGLMTTFHPNIPHSKWIGYQVLAGFGIGFGVQQPLIAVQVVLNIADVPTGTALMVFMQVLGGALFVSVDENVFSNKLVQYIV